MTCSRLNGHGTMRDMSGTFAGQSQMQMVGLERDGLGHTPYRGVPLSRPTMTDVSSLQLPVERHNGQHRGSFRRPCEAGALNSPRIALSHFFEMRIPTHAG